MRIADLEVTKKMANTEFVKSAYFDCQGSIFHMSRDYREAYEQYKLLNPGEDLLREWDSELLEMLFAKLWEKTEKEKTD